LARCKKDLSGLIAHELVHVRQYEQAGSVWRFMVDYIFQCLAYGYHDAPMEREARDASRACLNLLRHQSS
ncbi:MAG: hypothetical protein KJO79_04050, partial [Verrucomicrobiae bacterium]|nr:hypothetical protein [Verrucomicrobiae bacterium]